MFANPVSKFLLAGCVILISAAVLAACGSDDDGIPEPSAMGEIVVVGDDDADREIGLDLRRYLARVCAVAYAPEPPMDEKWGPRMRRYAKRQWEGMKHVCRDVESFEVIDGQITARSRLDGSEPMKTVGSAFCNVLRGSDAADSTPGHELLDDSGESVVVCGETNAYR